MTKDKINFDFDLPTDAELVRLFADAKTLEKFKVLDSTVRAAGPVIRRRFKELVPDGSARNAAKRSNEQKSEAAWHLKTKDNINTTVRKYSNSASVFVGPKWPVGNKLFFVADWEKSTREVFYWGEDQGKSTVKRRNISVQAAEETKTAQLSAMKKALRKMIDKMMKV